MTALEISGFSNDGIVLRGGGGNTISGNVIGTDAPGHPNLGNRVGIVRFMVYIVQNAATEAATAISTSWCSTSGRCGS